MDLQKKKIVVAGGSSGIGLATAMKLTEAGAWVVILGRDAAKLEAAKASTGNRASVAAIDAKQPHEVREFFARLGGFDHLVISVGGDGHVAPFLQQDDEVFRAYFDRKFWAYLTLAREGARHIAQDGSITFVGGAASRMAVRDMSAIAACNGAIDAMVPPLALELAPVRVNSVSPGVIATPYWDKLPEQVRQQMYDEAGAASLVGRVGQPEDIAEAICYFITNSFTTGTVLEVHGGRKR